MNEHHDVAAARAAELGAPVPATMASMGDEGSRESLFVVVMNNAFAGRPSLREAGYRVWIMAGRCFVPVPKAFAADKRAMREIATQCNGGLTVPRVVEAQTVFELILGRSQNAWEMGRRASLLAYALNRSVIIREALPSFEEIGKLWGLRAANKRSAVCAAMNKLRKELVKSGKLPASFRFWFEKSADARAVYEQCQAGNDNRHGSGEIGANYQHEVLHGVPVKQKFARLKPGVLRQALNRLHAVSEMRRLGIYEGENNT